MPMTFNYKNQSKKINPRFELIDTTLREGEQFSTADFKLDEKIAIAKLLDQFGIKFIEVTSPVVSNEAFHHCKKIASLDIKAKVLTHVRCSKEDIIRAIDTGVDGLNLYFGTSYYSTTYGHGYSIEHLLEKTINLLEFIKKNNPSIEIRFSTEDSSRTEIKQLLKIYKKITKSGLLTRIGISDTIGISDPFEVYNYIKKIKNKISTDIEFHAHNDTGCAIANSYAALIAGAKYIDTSVLGIGERSGITSLAGIIARLHSVMPEVIKSKYNLMILKELVHYVSDLIGFPVPFNHFIVGETWATHKAGVHLKAVLQNPQSYEIFNPEDFGIKRKIKIAHKLVGWNALKEKSLQMKLDISDSDLKILTRQIKETASEKKITEKEIENILIDFHRNITKE